MYIQVLNQEIFKHTHKDHIIRDAPYFSQLALDICVHVQYLQSIMCNNISTMRKYNGLKIGHQHVWAHCIWLIGMKKSTDRTNFFDFACLYYKSLPIHKEHETETSL